MIVLIIPIMKTLTEQFHATVEEFLKRTGFKTTEFGRQAVGDPSLRRCQSKLA